MMGRIGVPELVIILTIGLMALAPIAVVAWLVLRLLKTRANQSELEARIEALERAQRQR
jgi:hypothetical protein